MATFLITHFKEMQMTNIGLQLTPSFPFSGHLAQETSFNFCGTTVLPEFLDVHPPKFLKDRLSVSVSYYLKKESD